MEEKKAPGVTYIENSSNFQIGNRYYWSEINNILRNYNRQRSEEVDDDDDENEALISLPDELIESERKIEVDEFYVVAKRISNKWKKLARFLPPKNVFTEGELKILESDNKDNLEETIVQMLTLWKERRPDLSTVGNLAITLQSIERADIAILLHP
ncbi:uncharacterized protein [Centruroides vittatus]|uniref:uncharacterized protein n=1 Tax=Centruroides vittatus TaxID=120091 RepID=UPI00350E9122